MRDSIPTATAREDTLPMGRSDVAGHAPDILPAVDVAGHSERGADRARNEDHYAVCEASRWVRVHSSAFERDEGSRSAAASQGLVLAVADGMGGHAAGDVASQVVIEAFVDYLLRRMPWQPLRTGEDRIAHELGEAVRHCQQRLANATGNLGGARRPGTTLTAVYVTWPVAHVVHVGDSRAYLVRDGVTRQLTRDHTLAQELIDHGGDTDFDPGLHNVLYQAIGGAAETVVPDVRRLILDHEDILVLCSDGVYGTLPERELTALAQAPSSREAAHRMVARAVGLGGRDDATSVVAQFRAVV